MAAEQDYSGCIQLCDDIIAQGFEYSGEAALLRDDCMRRRASLTHQGKMLLKGFLSGDVSSAESAAGAVVSDLTLYGDLRDLGIQGLHWISNEPTDGFIVAMSAVGVATELADWVDWIPSVLKNFKRAGVLTRRFTQLLARSARGLAGTPAARRAAIRVFSDVGSLLRRVNPHRGKAILRGVDTARELRRLTRAAAKSPARLHLACRSVGAKKLAAALGGRDAERVLRVAARKGAPGVQALRTLRAVRKSRVARHFKWAARFGKVFYSRHAAELARRLIERAPQIRLAAALTALVFALAGAYLAIPPVWKLRRGGRTNDPSSGGADVPTSSETPERPTAADSSASGRGSPRKVVLRGRRRRRRRRFPAPRA